MKPIDIINKLNEAEEVKKPYGNTPQERGKEKLERGKVASLPKKEIGGSLAPSKFYKLKKNNAKAADIYTNDTDKVLDEVEDKNIGKGIINNKATLTRKAKLKKIVKYGDKPQPAINNKLIKESAEGEEDYNRSCAEYLFDLYNKTGEPWKVGEHLGGMDEVAGFCKRKGIDLDKVEPTAIEKNLDLLAGGKLDECGSKKLKEDYDNGTWKRHQDVIENELEAAKADMEEDAFADFCDGIINLVKNYTGEFDQYDLECNTPGKIIKEENLDEGMRNSEIKAKLRVVLPTDCTVGDIHRKSNNEASVDILSSGKKVLDVRVIGLYFYLPEHPGVKYNSESDAALDELKAEILTALGR